MLQKKTLKDMTQEEFNAMMDAMSEDEQDEFAMSLLEMGTFAKVYVDKMDEKSEKV